MCASMPWSATHWACPPGDRQLYHAIDGGKITIEGWREARGGCFHGWSRCEQWLNPSAAPSTPSRLHRRVQLGTAFDIEHPLGAVPARTWYPRQRRKFRARRSFFEGVANEIGGPIMVLDVDGSMEIVPRPTRH